ncbi:MULTISPECIES: AAA family ATPase [unclassified Microcoleus]|uniref:trifunctional serine/threonine-protein kinase/ATP-binding protein/sensor histidine kinase n=1 Tax=unclassified Microcoleus TaxID=2642155 RepID=UPI002FD06D25
MTDTSLTIPGYRILDRIYNGSRTQVYRAISESDQKPVAIKILQSEYPSFNELVQFRNQYTITKNLDLTGIVKPLELSNYRNGFALVMEDFGGISISEYTTLRPLTPDDFLPIAIQIVKVLEGLYRERIIHKDIKPQNILINPNTREIKIIDFSISSLLPRENQEIKSPNVLEGTLNYMSPEQTGRMNRGIDYRTDFYSLGVTFYELLTGQLPFKCIDAMELVHCHIAKMPTPPMELVATIPIMVNDIIMKLMAKNPESRYQNAFGLRYDLETCWQQWQATGKINQFTLAARDICDRFAIPEKLYGRETEVNTLLAAFDRVSEGNTEIILVAGFSGIGKTAAVNEVHKPIVGARGYFIKGKFDQFKRDIPFSAWVQAFQNLMRQLLAETSTKVQQWQAKILKILGDNAQVIIDVIPELEHLIGKQPKVQELEGNAAQNRFNLLFGKFIGIFATKEHPLVIFLDDLQWADSASLKLMQLLVSETDTRYLLLIGAYRDNEVFGAHPLILTLDELRKNAATVNQITLVPLDKPSLNCLIADTMSCPLARAFPLTELVLTKTKGNPFFATQFLKSLYGDGLITFDVNHNYWQCDIARVRSLALNDDVVEFMAIQLQKLPVNTQEILKLAACIGNQFDLSTLAIVNEKSQTETAAELWTALQEGLVIPITEVYKFFQDSESVEVGQASELSVPYKFLHDRVQQAAYFLIPEEHKQSTHLKIGQLLLRNTPESAKEEKIFDIVNQLNIGVDLIDSQTERDELAQLNLIAGSKAKNSTAYIASINYLNLGRKLLAKDSWKTIYELTLSLYVEASEVAYLNADFEQMEQLASIVLQQAKNILDTVKIYEVKIYSSIAETQQLEAIEIGLQVLPLLGVNLPASPTHEQIEQTVKATAEALAGKSNEELLNLSPMTDEYKLAALRIISSMTPAAAQSAPFLTPHMGCEEVNLLLEYGHSLFSPYAFADYAIILNIVVGDFEASYRYGCFAVKLVEHLNAKKIKSAVLFKVAGFSVHSQQHLRSTQPLFAAGYQSGLENGDLAHASYCAIQKSQYAYFGGQELSGLEQEMANYSYVITQKRQITPLNWIKIFWQATSNLLGKTKNPLLLIGEVYNELEILPALEKANDRFSLHSLYLHKMILSYLFDTGEFEGKLENAVKSEEFIDGCLGFINVPIFCFYDSLVRLSIANLSPEIGLLKVKSNQAKLLKFAQSAPMNFQHKYDLVEAEKARVLGNSMEAMNLYDRAIELAQENDYINDEALAHELAAKFYIADGKEKIARVYLTDAYYAYARWGAKAKVDDLERRYPQLLAPILNQKTSLETSGTISPMTDVTLSMTASLESSGFLDLATVIKASQALSGEIQLDKLLSTLMQTAIENAGASKGALILYQQGNLIVEALGTSDASENVVLQSIPLETSRIVPISLINYVARTEELLLYNNVPKESQNINDSYIIECLPKSVLCLPIQHQGKIIAILYLENNLTTNAFTPDRLAVLKILSSQAAISIENAQLYANLEAKVEERTQELSQALSYLEATQAELIQSEKMAALGQLVAGVAHEVNTPLGAIRSSAGNVSKFLNQTLEQLPALFQSLSPEEADNFLSLLQRSLQQEASLSTKEERKFKRALRGQLQELGIADPDTAADRLVMMGVYQEIDSFVPLLQKPESLQVLEMAYKLSELKRGLATIDTATDRASKVVFALKTYARYEQSGEKTTASITEGIETILTLYQNQLKQGVEVVRNYAEIPPILCYPDELNQVWTNLVHNALQAMDYRGRLIIDLVEQDGQAKISVTDSGKGIPFEIKAKIFEPFFTTKPAGEGSGLGLDIVKKILAKHQGKIEVESIPGQTTFHVFLPMSGV